MDPFDARLQYIQLLETLNPSQLAMSKAVQFALKNSELHEDFHSCILEVLDKLDLNAKMNVLYYIQELITVILQQPSSKRDQPYLKNFETNFKIILEKVIPSDNLINLRDSVDILINLEKLYGVDNEQLKKFYTNLTWENSEQPIPSSFETNGFAEAWLLLIQNKILGFNNRLKLLKNEQGYEKAFTKEQILSRIETDRERHKRVKEVSWAISRISTGNSLNILKNCIDANEFDKLWDQHDELTEEDFQELKELSEIAKASYNF